MFLMKVLSYNARGLGGGEKRNEVRRLVCEKHPFVLCLQESKLSTIDDRFIHSIWGGNNFGYSYKPSVGASGGLVTVWDLSVIEVWCSMNIGHALAIKGKVIKTGEVFFLINVYAPCDLERKRALWESLHVLVTNNQDTCLCLCGDFNSVRCLEERKGRSLVFRQLDADLFNNFIEDNFLIDLPICGRLFTWYRGDGVTMSRLYRFLLSDKWCEVWPNCVQVAYQRGLSDHVPLFLHVDDTNWGPRPLRMLKCWADFPGYDEFVREKWASFNIDGWGGYVLKQKLKFLKNSLKEWHCLHSQNLEGKMAEVKDRIAVLDAKGESFLLQDNEVIELHGLSANYHSLARVHNSICWQKSRMKWLKEGDANSKFFHGVMNHRRRHNTISMVSVGGVNVEGVHNIRSATFNHFSNFFKASREVRPDMDGLNFRKISFGEAGTLTKPFNIEEVKKAVWDCDGSKSPGPDGISFDFIKKFWDILKEDFMRFLSEFHRNGKLANGINSTFIALIPKVQSPQGFNDLRPISLVGCLYKVLAKVLANRLKSVINKVVSDTQSAFVKGKQILDGILIANEVVDEARRLGRELILFKVDFEKAYDSVDFNYLDAVMAHMNFPTLWRKWIFECVGTAKASVLVNGCPTEEFPLERGLRQGDPLSPFLFLLVAEGFNVLMNSMVEEDLFHGYGVGNGDDVRLSHLQFADDTLIIGEKSWLNVRSMRAALMLFEQVSGLKVNFQKSLLTGVNIADSWLSEASGMLNCRRGTIPFVYLGLPIGGDSRRLSFWKPVVDNIAARLSSWNNTFLSFGGRLVLLKSVLSSLPVYFLSFFKAPAGIISSIESLFKRFFLGGW